MTTVDIEFESEVAMPVGGVVLSGTLSIPRGAAGLVVFAHGSGSSRFSPRNRTVAAYLQARGLATLLFDLLSGDEDEIDRRTREFRFDIRMLSARLVSVVSWLRGQPRTDRLNLGLFGSSTGAAAALIAAAAVSDGVLAVVCRGGRPDLAADALAEVRAPTLLIVGGDDREVIALNERAQAQMNCMTELVLVPGATHLFEEPGALEQVMQYAAHWMQRYLGGPPGPSRPAPAA